MMRKNINKTETIIIIIHLSVKERPAALLSYAELPRRINTVGDVALKGQTVLASMEKALCSIPSPKNRKEKKERTHKSLLGFILCTYNPSTWESRLEGKASCTECWRPAWDKLPELSSINKPHVSQLPLNYRKLFKGRGVIKLIPQGQCYRPKPNKDTNKIERAISDKPKPVSHY